METVYRQELLSGLQKSIRRDETNLALECAKELELNGYNIWNKIEVYSAEDIGRACPWIASYVYNKKQEYLNETDIWKKRSIILNIVHYLCKQNKSRIADNAVHAYFKTKQPSLNTMTSKISDLKEMFNSSLKSKNMDDTLKVASHLYKLGEENYMVQVLDKQSNDPETKALISQFIDANNQSRDKFDLLFLVNIILHQTMDLSKLPVINNDQISPLTVEEIKQIYNKKRIETFPDWVYDKHTVKGRELGRGMRHFYDVSAKLINCYLDDPYEKMARNVNNAN